MINPIRFVILSQPRTGSTLLCSLLCDCPGVRALVEPINPSTHSHHMRPSQRTQSLLPEDIIQHNIAFALDTLFSANPPPIEWIANRKRGDVAAGFKIMAHQLLGLKSEMEFWDYLAARHIKVILCFRQNILMQYVSDLITIVTKQPSCWDGNVRTARVKVNIETLHFELQKITDQRRYLIDAVVKNGLDHQLIEYESFRSTTQPIEALLYWLIGEWRHLTTKLLKQNPDSLQARVMNYNELVAAIHDLGRDDLLGEW